MIFGSACILSLRWYQSILSQTIMIVFVDRLKIGKRENPLFRFYLCPQSTKALNELYSSQPTAAIDWMCVLSKIHLMVLKKMRNYERSVNNIFILI